MGISKIWNKWSFLISKKWDNLNKKGKILVCGVAIVVAYLIITNA
jgi:hypothetical protein